MTVPGAGPRASASRRRSVRHLAAGLAGMLGVLYLVLMFLVKDAESVPGATDSNTYGGYLFLAVAYLVGAALLATLDRRLVWVVGAAVQVLVLGFFVLFGVGVFGPGVFEYDALDDLSIQWWAAAATAGELVLLGLLGHLLLAPPPQQ
ncbi:hypothetical protein [Nocardioides mesophilus]|uniref:DUF4383 domain-containing protein n=1 Tax=Nocardioides mesophilus TaxID=433659 RepID=A0A7G9RFJ2_9ACTN|nr:hypothetical protein [Nocardioides mesophilus]QNN54367.1 hypothetical protein H9L09_08580 [Nocardioides mesophilus]